jgi:hypothetical protein
MLLLFQTTREEKEKLMLEHTFVQPSVIARLRQSPLGPYVDAEYRKIKRPFPTACCAHPVVHSPPPGRPQRASGGPWPRQRRPPGVGQQALGLLGGLSNAEERNVLRFIHEFEGDNLHDKVAA